MNINDLTTQYVTFCRSLGERCKTKDFILRAFCRAIGPATPIARISIKKVTAFLHGAGTFTNAWHGRYFALNGMFRFAISRGQMAKAPIPAEIPKKVPTLAPYIYSREEIRRLLDTIPSARHPRSLLEPATLRVILLLLYGAGLRRGEALQLATADVDLANYLLTIRNTKFFKSRLVAISADLSGVLADYARWRASAHPLSTAGTFFVNRRGEAVDRCILGNAFERLREHAGVRRSDGGRYQPRMHDLRHNAASRIMPTRIAG